MRFNRNDTLLSEIFEPFVKRLMYFILSEMLIIAVLFVYARSLSNVNTMFDDNIAIIVCGDSHMQSGINDSLLLSSMNISLTSQPYFYSYSVLSILLSNNPQIENVLLGYSYHSLSPLIDSIISERKLAQKACLDRKPYLVISPLSYVYQLVISDGFQELLMGSVNQIYKGMFSSEIVEMPYIGGYYSSISNNLSDENIDAAIQRHYYDEFGAVCSGVSVMQIDYLYKIAELCNKCDVELYLINTPISRQYFEAIPRSYIDNYYYIASTVDATFLDFHDFPLPDSCYGDADHLNYYGATEFSLYLDSLLNQ